jgi:hypothetical protein
MNAPFPMHRLFRGTVLAAAVSLGACSRAEPPAPTPAAPAVELATSRQAVTAEVSLLFPEGYIGTVGTNAQQANVISTFGTLNIARAGFFQDDSDGDGLFTVQGNDVPGTVKLFFVNGTSLSFPASLTWREASGSIINGFGFIPADCQADIPFPAPYVGSLKCVNTAAKSNVVFKNYTTASAFVPYTEGESRSGNAASVSQMLASLNAVLASAPKPSAIGLTAASVQEGGTITYTVTLSSATTFDRIFPFAFSGTATAVSDYLTNAVFSNGVVNNGDGTITVPSTGVTSFTVTVTTVNDSAGESPETLTLTVADKSATATITDDDAPITITPSTTTLAYAQAAAATIVDPAVVVTGGTGTNSSATVAVTKGASTLSEDVLACPAAVAIAPRTCSVAASGVLTISGAGTNAEYEAALRLVTYTNAVATNALDTGLRTITFSVTDSGPTTGTGTRALQPQAQATVTVTPPGSTVDYGVPTTFTATLGPSSSTGTIQWKVDSVNEGTPVTVASGTGTLSNLSLMPGTYTISAVYSGDTERLGATGSTTFTVAQLGNGVGPCTATNQVAVCVSDACNTTTNTCGGPVNTTCTNANQCAGNVCDGGKCGTTNGNSLGAGACTAATAAAVCQSGTCSVNSANCIPAAGGCYVDGDCAANQHCNRTTLTCVGDLANGVAIPTDGIRTGACGSSDAVAACLSGQCNVTTNTCAGPNTTTTCSYSATATSAPECATNVCGSNGKCGGTSGTAGCTAGTALASCQSGLCSTSSGTCIAAGTCWVDSDCTAAQFCNRNTGVCTTDLNAGISMPSDGLHSAVCNAPDALAVCTTGLCNAVANTCGKPNGQSCSAANQCASNTCTGGVCVPAGGCSVDANCSADKFCNPSTLTCVSDLTAGTALPNDSLHNGVCSTSLAAVVCASGQCNASTNTCSAPNGSACTGASGCTANVCQNSVCGTANGNSPGAGNCTTAAASTVCQSGTCSTNGANCIPASNGCYVDADCAAAKHCDRNALTCVDDKANGVAIPNDGLHDGTCTTANASAACASGQCNAVTNTCAGPNTATSCTAANQCVANVCGANGKCGLPDGSGPCFGAATSCQSGTCNATADGSVSACVPTGAGKCWVDGDCPATDYCARNVFTCKPKESNGTALPADTLHDACATGNVNAACVSGRCNAVTNTCGGPNTTTSCTAANQCIANACGTNGKCGRAEGEAGCTAATASTLCQSSTCSANSGTCITAGTCWTDGDCAAPQHCNRNTGACTADKANGVAIPNDGLHTGTCNTSNASATCESTGCNATTNTCAGPNTTTSCTNVNECVTNACGSNGKCGLANGQAGCTSSNTAVCQSGTCSVNNANCIPATNGCYVDGDCPAAKHCDRANLTCVDDKGAGVAIPNDGLHTGVCNDANALATCQSGKCNAVSNTCAEPNGNACTSANQCVVNVCGSNGKCGYADGQSGCTTTTPSVCQSNVCTASGVCLPAGKCWVDSDCPATDYCARNVNTCRPKEASGTPIPNDGLHDGGCTEANAQATCASGKCNAETKTCGDVNASTCAQASQCTSNVCYADGACGLPDNQSCATSSACRSGACVQGLCAVADAEIRGNGGLSCAVTTTQPSASDETSPAWLFGLALTLAVSRRRKGRDHQTGAKS